MSVVARRRFVVLISGQGTNMQAIVNYCATPASNAEVSAVIASRSGAPGLEWASNVGLPAICLAHTEFDTREDFDQALAKAIDAYEPDYVLLAGFMRVLTETFVKRYAGRLVNIHPSLLPAFPGLHTHRQALAQGVQVHGCTVHFVTPQLDHGPIIAQGVIPVQAGETAESLSARVLKLEHRVYSEVCEWLAQGWVALTDDQRVTVENISSRSFFG